jgi:MFS family permease
MDRHQFHLLLRESLTNPPYKSRADHCIHLQNTTFFQHVGIRDPFLISMVTTIVNVVSTPVSFYAIEKFGRRPLLIWGAVGMCVCEFIVAIIGTVAPDSEPANYCLIVFVCIYIFFFASSWGPTAWVVIGEIFHLPIRAKGVALSTASNWFWNCVIGAIVPLMVDSEYGNLGPKVFFVWGAACALSATFAYLFVPETKGLTLEQVDQMMEEVPARKTRNWRPDDGTDWDFGYSQQISRPNTTEGKSPNIESFIK